MEMFTSDSRGCIATAEMQPSCLQEVERNQNFLCDKPIGHWSSFKFEQHLKQKSRQETARSCVAVLFDSGEHLAGLRITQ